MPVDRTHAFADGPVYPKPRGLRALSRRDVADAWRSFSGVSMGADCRLGPNARCVASGTPDRISIGSRTVCRGVIRREPFGDGRIVIGDDVYVGDDCIISCAAAITIGDGVLLGHGVQVFDNNSHPVDASQRAADWSAIRWGGERPATSAAAVSIGRQAWLGFGVIVLRGVWIGDEAIVGAGSVVTRDVEARSVVAGNPAVPVS